MTEPVAMHTLRAHLAAHIVGQSALVDRLLIGLLTGGHLLVEGLPGLAKTTAVKALAEGVHARFKRIQFTPDLLPADLLGNEIYHPETRSFSFEPGPLFNEIILADEINRAPAKVQSALLEAMAERQVTVAGENAILSRTLDGSLGQAGAMQDTELSVDEVLHHRAAVRAVHCDEKLQRWVVDVVAASRAPEHAASDLTDLAGMVLVGASPRGALAWVQSAQALAWLNGRDFIVPDDLLTLAPDVLRHRLILGPKALVAGISRDGIISRLCRAIALP